MRNIWETYEEHGPYSLCSLNLFTLCIYLKDEDEEDEEEDGSVGPGEQYRPRREDQGTRTGYNEDPENLNNDPEKNIHKTSREDCINRISKGNIQTYDYKRTITICNNSALMQAAPIFC